MPDWKAIDTAMTKWRKKIYRLLRDDLKIGAEKGCFDCKYFNDGDGHKGCDQSVPGGLATGRKGDWPYVGRQYGEALVGGKKARVLFVSMDRPGRSGTREWRAYQEDWREGALHRSTEHMGGVAADLKYLLDPGASREVRCQQFALVNSVFCGPPPARALSGRPLMSSRSSSTMKENCRKHIRRLIQALEPDIVIAQGVKAPAAVCRSFGPRTVRSWAVETRPTSVEVAEGEIGLQRVWFLFTYHPGYYRRFGFDWKGGCSMPDELAGALDFVRDRYAG